MAKTESTKAKNPRKTLRGKIRQKLVYGNSSCNPCKVNQMFVVNTGGIFQSLIHHLFEEVCAKTIDHSTIEPKDIVSTIIENDDLRKTLRDFTFLLVEKQ